MSENEWAARLRDAILDNSALRDGLLDEEAQPLIDWGLALAAVVTAPLPTLPDPEMRYEELYDALPKLMTRITWVTIYRQNKGADWTTRTLQQLNELNIVLHGETAPQIPALQMSAYAEASDGLSNGALVQALMQHLSLPIEPEEEYIYGETS